MTNQTQEQSIAQRNKNLDSLIEKRKQRSQEIEDFAEQLSDAYSSDAYGNNWIPCIKALRRQGLTNRQIEAVIRSKWTRWAGDASKSNRYGQYTAADLMTWMKATQTMESVKELELEYFGPSDDGGG